MHKTFKHFTLEQLEPRLYLSGEGLVDGAFAGAGSGGGEAGGLSGASGILIEGAWERAGDLGRLVYDSGDAGGLFDLGVEPGRLSVEDGGVGDGLGGEDSSEAILNLRPSDPVESIGIGDGAAGDYQLTQADLDELGGKYGAIVIGGPEGRHSVQIGSALEPGEVSVHGPLVIQTPGIGGRVEINGGLTGASLTILGSGHTTLLNAATIVQSADVIVADAALIKGTVSVTSTGGHIEFWGSVDGDGQLGDDTLTLNAVNGSVAFEGRVGQADPLESLTISGGQNVTFDQELFVNGNVTITANGVVTFWRPVVIQGGGSLTINDAQEVRFRGGLTVHQNIAIEADDIDFEGGPESVKTLNNGTLELRPKTVSWSMEIGSPMESTTVNTLNLTREEVETLAEGFRQVTFGRKDGEHAQAGTGPVKLGVLRILGYTFRDPTEIYGGAIDITDYTDANMVFITKKTLKLDAVGNITLYNTVQTEGALTFYSASGKVQQQPDSRDGLNSELLVVSELVGTSATGMEVPWGKLGSVDVVNTGDGDIRINQVAAGGSLEVWRLAQTSAVDESDIVVNVESGSLTVTAGKQGVSNLGSGTTTFTTPAAGQGVVVNQGITFNSGALVMTAAGSISNTALIRATGAGDMTLTAGTLVDQDADMASAGGAIVVRAQGGMIDMKSGTETRSIKAGAGSGSISYTASTDVRVSVLNTDGLVLVVAGNGGIIDNRDGTAGSDSEVNIIGDEGASFSAVTGIGSADDLDVQLGGVSAVNSGARGNILITELAAGGDISVSDLTLSNAGSTGVIRLEAVSGSVTVTGTIHSPRGSVSVLAGASVNQGASSKIEVISVGTIDVEATAGSIVMSDGASAETDGKNIRYKAGVDATIGRLDARSAADRTAGVLSNQSAWGDVAVIAGTGTIKDAEAGDAAVNIWARQARFSGGTGVGELGAGVDPLETEVMVLSGRGGSGKISILESSQLTVGTVGQVPVERLSILGAVVTEQDGAAQSDLVTSNNGTIVLRTVNGTLTLNDGDANNEVVSAGGSGNILIEAQGSGQDLIINTGVKSGSGHITLLAADELSLATAASDVTSGGGTMYVEGGSGGLTIGAGVEVISNGGDIHGKGTFVQVNGLIDSGAGDTRLVASGGSIFDGGAGSYYVSGVGLRLEASVAISSMANPLNTKVGRLSGQAAGGVISILESDGVRVGSVGISIEKVGANGQTTTVSETKDNLGTGALPGAIVLRTESGSLGVEGPVSAFETSNILLQAGGWTTSDVTIDAAVESGSGNVTILATASVIQTTAGVVRTGGSGTIDVEGTSGSIMMSGNGLSKTTGSGDIRYKAAVDVKVGALEAGDGDISVIATSGGIVDWGDWPVNIKGKRLRLVAGRGIGVLGAAALLTQVGVVSGRAAGGGINLLESDGLEVGDTTATVWRVSAMATVSEITDEVQSDLVTSAGDGSIEVRSTAGSITINDGSALGDNIGLSADGSGSIVLRALGNGGDIDVKGDLRSGSGDMTVSADRSVTFYSTADIRTGLAGEISVSAVTGALEMKTNTMFVGASGQMQLSAAGKITIAEVDISSGAIEVVSGDNGIEVLAGEGGIVAGGASVMTFQADNGVTLNDEVTTAGVGTIRIDADVDDAGGGKLVTTTGGRITSAGGTVTVTASDVEIGGIINGGAGRVIMQPSTAGTIQVGALAGAAFNLSAAEADIINAGVLEINGSGFVSAVTFGADVDLTSGDQRVGTLVIRTQGTVTASAGGVVVPSLGVVADGAVTFTDVTTAVVTVAINTSNDPVVFTEKDGFEVGTVDGGAFGLMGMDGSSVDLAAVSGNVIVKNTGAANDIDATAGIAIDLQGNEGMFRIEGDEISWGIMGTTAGGVSVSADNMDIGGRITAMGQTVSLENGVGADQIDLGSGVDTATATLELSDGELDRITASKLVIGSSTMGAITVSADIDLTDDPLIGTLRLESGSSVTGVAGGLKVGDLAISAGGKVELTDASTAVDNVSIQTSSGDVIFVESNGFVVGTVDGIAGVGTGGGKMALRAADGNVTVNNTGLADDISATAGIEITLSGDEDLFVVNGGAQMKAASNGVTVSADNIDLAGTVVAAGQVVWLKNSVGADEIKVGTTGDGTADTLEISLDEIGRVTAQTLRIGRVGAGNLTVRAAVAPAGVNVLSLITGGTLTQSVGAPVTVNELAVDAGGAVTLTEAGNDVVKLAIDVAAGAIQYRDANSYTVGSVDGESGVDSDSGTVTLEAVADGAVLGIASGRDVSSSAGWVLVRADNMALAGTITAVGQTVTLVTQSAADAINLGSVVDTTDSTLELSDGELDGVSAAKLVIGTGESGAITVSAAVTVTGAGVLHLRTGSTVMSEGQGGIGGNALAISAGGTVRLTGTATDVVSLAIRTSWGAIEFRDATGFRVADVDGAVLVSGVGTADPTTAGTVTLRASDGDLTIGNTGALNDVEAKGLITIVLTGDNKVFQIEATADVESGSGQVTITSDEMDLDGTITVASGQIVTLQPWEGGEKIDLGSTGDTLADTLELSASEINQVRAGTGTLRIGRSGEINAGDLSISGPIAPTGARVLSLLTGGKVTQSTQPAASLDVDELVVKAGGAVTLTDVGNDVDELAMEVGSGSAGFTDADGFTVGTVDGVIGIDVDNGTVDLKAVSGNIVISDTTEANDIEASGKIEITLSGDEAVLTISNGADIESLSGDVVVTADEVELGGTITAVAGTAQGVTLRPNELSDGIELGGSAGGSVADVLELSNAEFGQVTTDILRIGRNDTGASGNISLVGAVSYAPSALLVSEPVLHLYTGGAVLDNNGTGADVTVVSLAIHSKNGIAAAGSNAPGLELEVTNLAYVNESGAVSFSNAKALTIGIVDGVNASSNAGATTIKAAGPITISAPTTSGGALEVEAIGAVTFAANTSSVGPLAALAKETAGVNQTQDDVVVNAGVTVQATTDVILRAGDAIGIENRVIGGVVSAGDVVVGGNVTLESGYGDRDNVGLQVLDGTILTGGTVTVNLGTESGSASQGSSGTIKALNLRLLSGAGEASGGGSFELGTSTSNDVDVLAAASDGAVAYRDADGLTVGVVGTTTGITTTNDNLTLVAGGLLTIDEDIVVGSGTVDLNVAGATENSNDTIRAASLRLDGSGTFTLLQANSVGTLAGETSGGSVSYQDVDGLLVGTVLGRAGLSTGGKDLTLVVGGVLTIGNGTGQDITATSAVVDIDAGGATEGQDSIITAASLRLGGTGTFTLMQANRVGTLAGLTGGGSMSYTDWDGLVVGTVLGTAGLNTGGQNVTLVVSGLLEIGTDAGQDITATGAVVDIDAGGAIEKAGSIITAGGVRLRGRGSFTLAQENAVGTIAAVTNGVIEFVDGDDVTVGSVEAIGITTSDDDVTVRTVNGGITVSEAVKVGSGTVVLESGEAVEGTVAGISLGGDVVGGTVKLTSVDGVSQSAGVITAGGLVVRAARGADATAQLMQSNRVDVVAAVRNSSESGVDLTLNFKDADWVTIGAVDGVNGIVTGNGDVSVWTERGEILVNESIGVGSGVVLLNSGESNEDTTAGIRLGAGVVGLLVKLVSADGVLQSVGIIEATGLLVEGAAGSDVGGSDASVILTQANKVTDLAVARLSVRAGVDLTLEYKDADGITIGSVGGVNGIETGNGNATVGTVSGGIGVSQAIAAGTGTVLLESREAGEAVAAGIGLGANVSGGLVKLTSVDGISQGAGAITATDLAVRAVSGAGTVAADTVVNLVEANQVMNLAVMRHADGAGVNLTLNYKDADSITIGSVDGILGIGTGEGNVSVVTVDGGIRVSEAIGAGSGLVVLESNEVSESTDAGIALNAAVGGGTVKLVSADGISQGAGAIRAGGLLVQAAKGTASATVTLNLSNDVDDLAAERISGTGGVDLDFEYSDTGGLRVGTVEGVSGIRTGNGLVKIKSTGSLVIGDGSGADNIEAGSGTVDIEAAGVEERGLGGSKIGAGGLRLSGAGLFTLENQNTVGTLAADVAGELKYGGAGGLTIGKVLERAGVTTRGTTAIDHNLSLSLGGVLTIGDGASGEENVNVGTGKVEIRAGGVSESGDGSKVIAGELVLGGTGTFTLTNNNSVGVLRMSVVGAASFNGVGAVKIGAGGLVTGGKGLTLVVGSLIDENTTDPDIAASELILTVSDGVGVVAGSGGLRIEISVDSLDINNTVSGGVDVKDLSGGLSLSDLNSSGAARIAGGGLIEAVGPLRIGVSQTVAGGMIYRAGNSNVADDDLVIANNAVVTLDWAVAAMLEFEAGDDIVLGTDVGGSGQIMTQGGGSHSVVLAADREGSGVADNDRGSVTQDGAVGARISARLLTVTGAGIGAGSQPLVVSVDVLSTATNAVNGDQYMSEVNGLNDVDMDAGSGTITLSLAAGGLADSSGGTGDSSGDVDIRAQSITLNSVAGIGSSGESGSIEVSGSVVNAVNTGSGGIYLRSVGSGQVNFNQVNAQTAGGIELRSVSGTSLGQVSTAKGGISVWVSGGDLQVVASVTAGGSGNVALTTLISGNIILTGTTGAVADTVKIQSAGSINGAGLVSGGTIDLDAVSGIGTMRALELGGSALTIDSVGGKVDVDNALASAVTVNTVKTGNGGTIVFEQSGGGSVTFVEVRTVSATAAVEGEDRIELRNDGGDLVIGTSVEAGGLGDIEIRTVTSGDVVLTGSVSGAGDGVTINSVGSINGSGLVRGAVIDLDAKRGIGDTTALELAGSSLAIDSASGNVDVDNALGSAVTVSTLRTAGGGWIKFDQTGSGAVSFGTVSTSAVGSGADAQDDIALTNWAGGLIVTGSVTAGGLGDVVLESKAGGNITLTGAVSAIGDGVTINSAGSMNGSGLVSGAVIDLDAGTGIGNTTALELVGSTMTIDSVGGNVDVDNELSSAITVNTLRTAGGGWIKFDQTGSGAVSFGTVSTSAAVTAAEDQDDVTLRSSAGMLTVTGSIVAGGFGDILLETIGSGNIELTGTTTAAGDRVAVKSAGSINGAGLVTGAEIDLDAASGIGNGVGLELAGATLRIDSLGGNVDVANAVGAAVTVESLTTRQGGTIKFEQSGGGSVSFGDVSTSALGTPAEDQDDITLRNSGGALSVIMGGGVSGGGLGDVLIETVTSGNIVLGAGVSAVGDEVSLNAAGGISGAGLVRGGSVDLRAVSGIDLGLAAGMVGAANSGSGAVTLENYFVSDVVVSSMRSQGGAITFNQSGGGLLKVTGAVASGVAGTAGVSGGSIEFTNSHGVVVEGTASLDTRSGSGGGITIEGGVSLDGIVSFGAGNIVLRGGSNGTIKGISIGAELAGVSGINFSSAEDIEIRSRLNAANDIGLTADSDNNGTGGVRVSATGMLDAGRDVILKGSDLVATSNAVDALVIEVEGNSVQVKAGRNLGWTNQGNAPSNTVIGVSGRLSVTGSVTVSGGASQVTIDHVLNVLGPISVEGGDVILAESASTDLVLAQASGTLRVQSGGAINATGAVRGAAIELRAGTGIGTVGVVVLNTGTLLAETTDGNVRIENSATGVVTVTSLKTGTGDIVYVQNGGGSLSGGTVTRVAGNVLLRAEGADADVTVTSGFAGGGNVSIWAGRNVTQQGVITVSNAGSIDVEAGLGWVKMEAGSSSATAGGGIRYAAAGDIWVTRLAAGNGQVSLRSSGGRVLETVSNGSQIEGSALRVAVAGAFGDVIAGAMNPWEIAVSTIAVEAGGEISLLSSGSVRVGSVEVVVNRIGATGEAAALTDGALNGLKGGMDEPVLLRVLSGQITVDEPVIGQGRGTVLLQALGSGNVALNDGISSGSGSVTVLAGGNVWQNAGAGITVNAGGGSIDVEGSGGVVRMADGVRSRTSGGNIRYYGSGDVTVSGLEAGVGLISLSSGSGSVLDAGEAGGWLVQGAALRLRAGVSVGASSGAGAIETGVTTVTANAGSGGIYVVEQDAVTVSTVAVTVGRVLATGNTAAVTDNAQSDLTTSNNGSIQLQTLGGTITLTDGLPNSTSVSANGLGNVTIWAQGTGSDVVVKSAVRSGSGSITVGAGRNVVQSGAVAILVTSGAVMLDGAEISGLSSSGSGAVVITHSGAVTLRGSTTVAGSLSITANSPVLVTGSVSVVGDIVMQAGDSLASGDDLTVGSLAVIESTNGSVVLRAGDNVNLAAGSVVGAVNGSVTLAVDYGSMDEVGGSALLQGTIRALLVRVEGGSGDDGLDAAALGVGVVFAGGGGNDEFSGGTGADVYELLARGLARISDLGGVDALSFAWAGQGISVDLDLANEQVISLGGGRMQLAGQIENVIGSGFDDVITVDALVSGRQLAGGGNATGIPGDRLVVDRRGGVATTAATTVQVAGYGVIGYAEFETVSIVDTQVSIGNASVVEGNTGSRDAVFTVSLSGASSQSITVDFSAADGTGTAIGNDYTQLSGVVTFAPGLTAQQVTVPVKGDSVFEADETFVVNLSGVTNASIGQGVGTGTITNDDGVPVVSISGPAQAVIEGNSETTTTPAVFTVRLSNPSSQTVTVDFATQDGTATVGGNDYVSASGTVTFATGETAKTVTAQVRGDVVLEPSETFAVVLSNPSNGTLAQAQAVATIVNGLPNGPATVDIPAGGAFELVVVGDELVMRQAGGGELFRVLSSAVTALTITSGGSLSLVVWTVQMGLTVIGNGDVNISSSSGLVLNEVTTADGAVTIYAGGTLRATWVTAGGVGRNVSLTTMAGDIVVGEVRASGDTVNLRAAGAVVDGNGVGVNVSGLNLLATAAMGIDLDTEVENVTAVTSRVGAISLDEVNGVTLNNVTTNDGAITVSAGGTMRATRVRSGGTGRNVSLTTMGGDIVASLVTAMGDTVNLRAAGAVVDGNTRAVNVVAANLLATAAVGIDLDTNVDAVTAVTSRVGGISIDEVNAVVLSNVTTNDGAITVSAGATMTATRVRSGGTNRDVSLTTTAGNIVTSLVTAMGDTVSLRAAGAITDGNTTGVNVVAGNLVAQSASGIVLDTNIENLTAGVSGAGEIRVKEANALNLNGVGTADGAIWVQGAGLLRAAQVQAGGTSRALELRTTLGNVELGLVASASGAVTINAASAINELESDGEIDLSGTSFNLTAGSGIGLTGAIERNAGTMVVNTTGPVNIEFLP